MKPVYEVDKCIMITVAWKLFVNIFGNQLKKGVYSITV